MSRGDLTVITALTAALLVGSCGSTPGEPNGRAPTSTSGPSSGAQASGSPGPAVTLELTRIGATGGSTAATTNPKDGELYLTEQKGVVRRVRLSTGTPSVDRDPVLDVSDLVTSGGEQGLLGIAFSPAGDQMYLAYTNNQGNQQLDRFNFDGTRADRASRTTILTVPDFAPNHNGGDIVFGPDGYLWYGMGDGGGSGDPKNTGQNPKDLLGSLLRIDVSKPSADKPYSIPPDNPFADGRAGAPEVYAYGLRNPWRFSFDRETKDLWIADVGETQREEIDHVSLEEAKGANFGWSVLEGTLPLNGGAAPAGAVAPVYEYDHSRGGCAVIGGYVYRGTKIPKLAGTYLFSDNCLGEINGLRASGGTVQMFDLGIAVANISTFAQDASGELYALSVDGTIARIDGA